MVQYGVKACCSPSRVFFFLHPFFDITLFAFVAYFRVPLFPFCLLPLFSNNFLMLKKRWCQSSHHSVARCATLMAASIWKSEMTIWKERAEGEEGGMEGGCKDTCATDVKTSITRLPLSSDSFTYCICTSTHLDTHTHTYDHIVLHLFIKASLLSEWLLVLWDECES